jgi:plasmid maintenance system antidote protein VapI
MTTPKPHSLGSLLLRQAFASPTEPLNQAAVALQLGTSPVTVSKWASGQSRPSATAMVELEWLFKIDPEAWFQEATTLEAPGAPKLPKPPATPGDRAMKEVA